MWGLLISNQRWRIAINNCKNRLGTKTQMFIFWHLFVHVPLQGGDSDDDAEGFAGSDDTQPSAELPSQDLEAVSTYGEDDLVPEPHRVSNTGFITGHTVCGSWLFLFFPFFLVVLHTHIITCSCRSTRLRSTMLRQPRKWTWRDSRTACGLFWLTAQKNPQR